MKRPGKQATAMPGTRRWPRIVLALALLLVPAWGVTRTALGAAAIPIQEAIQDGKVDANAKSEWMGFHEPMVRLTVTSKDGSPLLVKIPVGTRLKPDSEKFAELVVGEEKQVTAAPEGQVDLVAYSLAPDKSLPSRMSKQRYSIGAMAEPGVLKHLEDLAASGAPTDYAGQLALWHWVTGQSLDDLIGSMKYPIDEAVRQRALGLIGLAPTAVPAAATSPTQQSAGSKQEVSAATIVAPTTPPGSTPAATEPPRDLRPILELLAVLAIVVVIVIVAVAFVVSTNKKKDQPTRVSARQQPESQGQANDSRAVFATDSKSQSGTGGNGGDLGGGSPAKPQPQQPQHGAAAAAGTQAAVDKTYAVDTGESGQTLECGVELIGVEGPLLGIRYSFADRCILSRGPVQWIVVRAPEISAPHAAVDFAPGESRIKDLRSRNGVLLGDQRLGDKFEPVKLGEEVVTGSVRLKLGAGSLVFETGPLAGQVVPLRPGLWTITREELRILDAHQDSRVSDVHALFMPTVLGFNLRDLNSSNGSWIGDEKITDERWATAGQFIRVGGSCLQVEVQFGRYRLIRVVGEGGMARVFQATDNYGQAIALKTPLEAENQFRERFTRETDILRSLNHKHIVPVYEVGEISGTPFVAMKFMPGGTLFDLLQSGRLPARRALTIAEQLAQALDYAHGRGLECHRDVKPSNVLLDSTGTAYLTDFGIARRATDKPMTVYGKALGTLQYMSPEQLMGKPVDQRTDIYSLGVVMYQMLSGNVPFDGTSKTVTEQKAHQPPPSPRSVNADVREEVEKVVMRCLAADPTARYRTAGELAAAIRAVNVS